MTYPNLAMSIDFIERRLQLIALRFKAVIVCVNRDVNRSRDVYASA